MSIVNFTSGINNIEHFASLSEWAVNYIFAHKLTRENHINSEYFRNLPRRQKDAVRYQLKKGNFSVSSNRIPKARNGVSKLPPSNSFFLLRLALSVWIACFLIADIVQIYTTKGINPWFAWQAAILVELCVIIASVCSEGRVRKIAYALLIYNASLFAFSEIQHLMQMHERKTIRRSEIADARDRKESLLKSIKSMNSFKEKSLSEMSALISKGYVSSVSNAVKKITTTLHPKEQTILGEVKELEKQISLLESESPNLLASGIISFLYFSLRCCLQLFSIWILSTKSATLTLGRKEPRKLLDH